MADGSGETDPLAARAAWLYHACGLTQADVARALGVTGMKAHRLLARAAQDGIVQVLVCGPIGGCIELEAGLSQRFGLSSCRVVPSVEGPGLPLQALGHAGASFIHATLDGTREAVVGVGHGRSVAAALRRLPDVKAPGLRLVSLLGGLPRMRTAGPFEMVQTFAERTGAEAWLMPVPFYAGTAGEREVLLRQRGVREAMAMAREAMLCLVGIGEVSPGCFLRVSEAVDDGDLRDLQAAGAVGEVLGRYFRADGQVVGTDLHRRVMTAPLEELPGLTAIAGGAAKVAAIRAVLHSGVLSALITDEATAGELVNDNGTGGQPCTTRRKTRRHASSPGGSAAAS